MRVLRAILRLAGVALLLAFIAINWTRAPVNFWPTDTGYLHFEWPVGIIALVFFLLGLAPTWVVAKARGWHLRRRIASLEDSVRAIAGGSRPGSSPANPADPIT